MELTNLNLRNRNLSKSTSNLNDSNIKFNKRFINNAPIDLYTAEDETNTFSDEFINGLGKTEKSIFILEKKLDRLTDMLRDQQNLLSILKNEFAIYNQFSTKCYVEPLCSQTSNHRAKSLIDAIEMKQIQYLDLEIKDSITKFLQSDELKNSVASTTADCVKSVISNSFAKTFPSTYMPILDNFHMRLLKYVTKMLNNAFRELEGNSAYFYKSVHKTSRSLRIALENHSNLLENFAANNKSNKTLQETLEDVLKNELAEWRHKLLNVLTSQMLPRPEFPEREHPPAMDIPTSPSQPADPDKSIIETLLKSAEIKKLIKEGRLNESFETALSSCDLSLVTAACRAATAEFAPSQLHQATLLSLVQQLATDMVHDTQLKCRYLEEAITNLNPDDPVTRPHLPLVVGEVRKHLSKFLETYPSHVAKRISLIILAANNLLK